MHPADRQLQRRLTRDARSADRSAARAQDRHLRAVARHERGLRRARRHLPVFACVSIGSLLSVLELGAGSLWLLVAGVTGVGAARSGALLLRPPAAPQAPSLAALRVPPPPPYASAAFPAVRRLEAARAALTRLLPLVAPAGREVAEEAWRAAGEADNALRWQAARLAAVEPHRGAEPALVDLLFSGVAAQERLVAGLADLVSASADPQATNRLQDATDALHGLARGLREVR